MQYHYDLYNKLFNSYKPNKQENRIYYNFKRTLKNTPHHSSINNRRKPTRTTTRKLNYTSRRPKTQCYYTY